MKKNNMPGQWDNHPINPATQRIISKIVGFLESAKAQEWVYLCTVTKNIFLKSFIFLDNNDFSNFEAIILQGSIV